MNNNVRYVILIFIKHFFNDRLCEFCHNVYKNLEHKTYNYYSKYYEYEYYWQGRSEIRYNVELINKEQSIINTRPKEQNGQDPND